MAVLQKQRLATETPLRPQKFPCQILPQLGGRTEHRRVTTGAEETGALSENLRLQLLGIDGCSRKWMGIGVYLRNQCYCEMSDRTWAIRTHGESRSFVCSPLGTLYVAII